MRLLRPMKVNSFVLFSFALFGFLIYILVALNKTGTHLVSIKSQAKVVSQVKIPTKIVHEDQIYENKSDENEAKNNASPIVQSTTVNNDHHLQLISDCSCRRRFMYPPLNLKHATGNKFKSFNSSCSDKGTFYQKNQKVITFSLYITNDTLHLRERYEIGVIANLHMMRKYYPGYSFRIYTNFAPTPNYCKILCANKDLFWCNVEYTPSHGNLSQMVSRTWRFLTLGDPTVDVFLSRDLDSLIFGREADVVKDWLFKGDKAISLMRDRPGGHNVSMLAGMWGASNNMLGMDNAANLREKIIEQSSWPNETYKASDQEILDRIIFALESENIVAYDSYNCVKWAKFTLVRPFPTRRGDPTIDFVANRVDFGATNERRNYTAFECPMECRPTYGQDWTFC